MVPNALADKKVHSIEDGNLESIVKAYNHVEWVF